MGFGQVMSFTYVVLYSVFSGVVIGATMRMWTLDWTDVNPSRLPLPDHVAGWSCCAVSGIAAVALMVTQAGGLRYELLAALFNTYLLFNCTEVYIKQTAVALAAVFAFCCWCRQSTVSKEKPS